MSHRSAKQPAESWAVVFLLPALAALIAFALALYNLDVFRRAVAQEGFAGRFGLDQARIGVTLDDDEALLELGLDWLALQFF